MSRGNTESGIPAAVQARTALGCLGVRGRSRLGFLALVPCPDVQHVGRTERRRLGGHERILARSGLEVLQLLGDVTGWLAGEFWPLRIGAVAVGAMAAATGGGLGLAGGGISSSQYRGTGEREYRGNDPDREFHVGSPC